MPVQPSLGTIEGIVNQPVRGEASRYSYEEFEGIPVIAKNDGFSAPTGATGDVNTLMTPGGNAFEYHVKGTQTILAPTFGALGYDISQDQTDNDGVEYTQGITARSKSAFTVGSEGFFLSVNFSIADVSGTDDCAVGFRAAAAYAANIDDYTDMAVLNVISGAINIETILNNGATTTTDTNNPWADGETHTLKIIVSKSGIVTYQIDGVAPTVTAAFTFDASDVVVPFFFFLHSADVAGVVNLKKWECGLL